MGRDAVAEYDKGARLYMMPEYRYFASKIRRKGIRSGRVLDIGTGTGRLAIELARARDCHFDIVALDISPDMLEKAEENARLYGVEDRIRFVQASAEAMPFPDNSFDFIVSYASLHHWFNPEAVFNEIARVRKENGHVIVRDNRRVYQDRFWKTSVWLVSRFMNRRHRENWPKAILASYTVPEVRELVGRSNLKDCSVKMDFLFIDLCIESSG